MLSRSTVEAVVLVSVFVASGAIALPDDPLLDLSGNWTYSTTGDWVNGVCPSGSPKSGAASIDQDSATFTLALITGAVCEPAEVCVFSGAVSGADYDGSNSVVVDDEGGTVTSFVGFAASSSTTAEGSYSATYVLDDFSCQWGCDIDLVYAPEPSAGLLQLGSLGVIVLLARRHIACAH